MSATVGHANVGNFKNRKLEITLVHLVIIPFHKNHKHIFKSGLGSLILDRINRNHHGKTWN